MYIKANQDTQKYLLISYAGGCYCANNTGETNPQPYKQAGLYIEVDLHADLTGVMSLYEEEVLNQ